MKQRIKEMQAKLKPPKTSAQVLKEIQGVVEV